MEISLGRYSGFTVTIIMKQKFIISIIVIFIIMVLQEYRYTVQL